jgi:hypothetical protein
MPIQPAKGSVSVGAHRLPPPPPLKPAQITVASLPSTGDPQRDILRRLERIEHVQMQLAKLISDNFTLLHKATHDQSDTIIQHLGGLEIRLNRQGKH